MKQELREICDDLRRLAEEQDWTLVLSLLKSLQGGLDSAKTIIVAPDGSQPDRFIAWVQLTSAQEALAKTFNNFDLGGKVAPHLSAFFPSDHLIEATEADIVAKDFFSRPPKSYAIVISVEGLTSEEDLQLVERSAWRLLVSDPPANTALAELRSYGVYLWNQGETADFLRQRVEIDRQALISWLLSPGGDENLLLSRQITEILNVAENSYRVQRSGRLSSQAAWTRDLAQASDNLSDFRSRLNLRLDGDAELLIAEVTGTMRTWSVQLRESIQAKLLNSFEGKRTVKPQIAQSVVEGKLREAAPVWAERISGVIKSHRDELRRDSEGLFGAVDWKTVNEAISRSGNRDDYPEVLISRAFGVRDVMTSDVSNAGPTGSPKTKEGIFARNLVVLGLPVTVGLSAAASWIMRFPLAIPVGLAGGLITTIAASQSSSVGSDLDQCVAFANEATNHFLKRSIVHFQSETRMVAAHLKQRLGKELDGLSRLIDEAMQNDNSADQISHKDIALRLHGIRDSLQRLAR